MSKKTEKRLLRLKRKSIIPSIIVFTLIFAISVSIVSMVFATFASTIIQGKYNASIQDSKVMARLVSEEYKEGKNLNTILEERARNLEFGKDFCIFDKDMNIVAKTGDITIDLNRKYDFITDIGLIEIGYIYADQNLDDEINLFKMNFIDAVRITFKDVENLVDNKEIPLDVDIQIRDREYMDKSGFTQGFVTGKNNLETASPWLAEEVFETYFWTETEILDTNYVLCMKCKFSLKRSDLIVAIGMVFIICFMVFILLVILLVNILVTIFSQRKTLKLLITDPVTEGNNWFYFKNQSSKILSNYRNNGKTFVMVDFTVNKFNAYRTHYGTEQSEKLLELINNSIEYNLKKEEVCAIHDNASFAILLKLPVHNTVPTRNVVAETGRNLPEEVLNAAYETSMEDCRERLKIIMEDIKEYLSRWDKEKNTKSIVFHVGACIIPSVRAHNGWSNRHQSFDTDTLYNNAVMARQKISETDGDSTILFNKQMYEDVLWEHKVEENMQTALDNEEFKVYIQPKYNPSNDTLAGGEALVRWISPTDGFINPGKFIPILEKTGFITRLDDYMISHVAELQAKWLNEGKKIVPVSVNVSRAHFAMENLAEHIRDLVDEYKLPHQYLEIELTESAFFDDKNALLTTVKRLQKYGFEVSMDDFGSGYSSLNSLKDLPLNVLKLDAEFFRGEDSENRGEIVVAEAIQLARKLDMRIVAEGVEKKEQVEFLKSQGCDMIQGFYYAKPLPTEEYVTKM
ncbi:MAG: EAL domain-containing protein [Treponema sp.]|nr:EAL domain-containing protein [Treponema sp.]